MTAQELDHPSPAAPRPAPGPDPAPRLHEHLHRWRRMLSRRMDRRHLSLKDFTESLQGIGVRAGATLMVHSSMDEIQRRVPELDALRLIRLLQELLGEGGTLLMPAFPFTGRQGDYVGSQTTFDVKRTPSRVGLLTEVFRRLPGVVRSLHPTHSVAGCGVHAAELLGEHHLGSAFGRTSPFYKLLECEGLVLGLGVGLRQGFTILHVAEEMSPDTREMICEPRPRPMTIVNGPERIPYDLYPLRVDVDRDLDRLERALRSSGTLRYVERHGLLFSAVHAREFVRRTCEQLECDSYLSFRSGSGTSRPPGS